MTPVRSSAYARAIVRKALGEDGTPVASELPQLRSIRFDQQIDLDDLLRQIVDEVTALLEADRGTLYLVDHARRELVSHVAHLPEISAIRLQWGEGIAGWVACTGLSVNVAESVHDARFADRIDRVTGYRTRTIMAVGVRDRDEHPIGVLQVLNKARGAFDDRDCRRLEALAVEVASLLCATSLRSQLRPGHGHALAYRFNHIVGESPAMRDAYTRIERAASTDATVLVRGESGSGKEAFARAVHFNSPRRECPFAKVDCAALPAQLIENELFGHERGAYTGADRSAEGKVRAAEGGTLFLDEVGELPATVQGKLLRLLQDRTYVKVGGVQPVRADVRFVCATHIDLESAVGDGRFRVDLYYRLRVVEIHVPPLRDRGSADLDRLIDHFVFEFGRRHGRPEVRLASTARTALHDHDWPGNVRELEHCIESAIVLSPDGGRHSISADQLSIGPRSDLRRSESGSEVSAHAFVSDLRPLREVEAAYIRHVLGICGGNRSAAARLLDIGRNTLLRRLKG